MQRRLASTIEMLTHGIWMTILHNAYPLLVEVKFSAATLKGLYLAAALTATGLKRAMFASQASMR